jgi:uncharacterized protein YbcC (UPF0753/DUF2309 family)
VTLILRAQVAAAAQDVVPSWPLESFIAVNPLAGSESQPFEKSASPGVTLTRSQEAYRSDYDRGRITDVDLEAALRERVPELAGDLTVGAMTVPVLRVAVLDLIATKWNTQPGHNRPIPWLDDYLATWASLYLSPDSPWSMPGKENGLYRAWRSLARRDPSLPRKVRRMLADLPVEPDAALSSALSSLEITAEAIPGALRAELRSLPGWVAHIKWRAEKVGDIDLTSYLAMRFTLRALLSLPLDPEPRGSHSTDDDASTIQQRAEHIANLISGAGKDREAIAAIARVLAIHPVTDHPYAWQKAYELHYRDGILPLVAAPGPSQDRASIQIMMCIDPRSEGMRRRLEEEPSIETFGVAGFFGIPVRFARYMARGAINSLPALLSARHQITELPTGPALAQKHVVQGRRHDSVRRATHVTDSSTLTPFAFAEATGWFYGVASVMRTLTPSLHARIRRALRASPSPLDSTVSVVNAFTVEERAAMAETTLRMLGMTRFAPIVIVAGHASESMNNLYESALDCGACGGNPGAANARAAASLFNDPGVRALLKPRGIDIPNDSFFLAAQHNTVTDVITLLDRHLLPQSHVDMATQFDRLQRTASDQLVRERARDLPGASSRHSPSRVRGRAHDWAEVYPELGLAGNAAMIIGPRRMTRGIDLGRRVFLHSYETQVDTDGSALESIMTAPLVVAQWINHQYYFSALNPTTLGAGTKTIHNAIGTIGVLAGHGGDLRRGLPWQSVGVGRELFHEPMRLTVAIQAPLERIGRIVSSNQVLRNLLDNDWITLSARDDDTAGWHRYTAYGWKPTPTALEGP